MLDVEFEWFDPQPAHDFNGLKTLLRQLLDVDALSFDLSALTDLILAQPLLGSTVKVEGNETDPYAFLTVLNLHEHKVNFLHSSTASPPNKSLGQASHPAIDQLHPRTVQAHRVSLSARRSPEPVRRHSRWPCSDRKTHQHPIRSGSTNVPNVARGNLMGAGGKRAVQFYAFSCFLEDLQGSGIDSRRRGPPQAKEAEKGW